jgi:hypothetical protein
MNKFLSLSILLMVSVTAFGQTVVGHVDKKTKEFFIPSKPKGDYKIFGYQYPNITTQKMICFSSYSYDVRDNLNKCPLGSYFETSFMKEGDRIVYLGMAGSFSKMNYIAGNGKKTLFYFPKGSFIIK